GSTLLHTGDRWVRIDADELRRQRAKLDELKSTRSRVTPLQLLQLANDEAATEDAPTIRVHEAGTTVGADTFSGDTFSGLGAYLDGVEIGSDPSGRESTGGHDIGLSARDWVTALLDGLPDEELDEATESAGFVGELRHYQRRGLSWMRFLASLGLGGCLADDMGLGKTATTLAHLLERPGPHLVVCPLSVVRNWRNESNRFTPFFEVTVHHGSGRDRGINALVEASARARDPEADIEEMFAVDPERQLVITTYGLLPRDLEHLGAIDWSTIVLDEAQMVKNPNTKAARAVRTLGAEQKLALTGTPVENRLSELWSILDVVNPGMLGSLEHFRQTYSGPIERQHDPDATARLRRLTGPFVLRRTKADKRLLPDLPDKVEQIAWATLTKEQAVLYQQVVDQLLVDAEGSEGMKRRGIVLAALMRLKQICNHPAHALKDDSRLAGRSGKLARFDELVTDLLDQGERALVFTQFREMGELLVRHVGEQFAMQAPFLHGGVTRTRRDRMVDDFQDGSGPPLLLVSLKAGGTGLNLTAASQVIHYDRWWNPAVEDQATDRAWRMGQTRLVNVHKLVCEGTVEEKVNQVIDDKRALAEQVVGTGENGDAWLSELSTDELRDLIVLEPPT
ncbi:MAG: DEAD/DEAH box helicase, partial [Actinomycetota bacterium]